MRLLLVYDKTKSTNIPALFTEIRLISRLKNTDTSIKIRSLNIAFIREKHVLLNKKVVFNVTIIVIKQIELLLPLFLTFRY